MKLVVGRMYATAKGQERRLVVKITHSTRTGEFVGKILDSDMSNDIGHEPYWGSTGMFYSTPDRLDLVREIVP